MPLQIMETTTKITGGKPKKATKSGVAEPSGTKNHGEGVNEQAKTPIQKKGQDTLKILASLTETLAPKKPVVSRTKTGKKESVDSEKKTLKKEAKPPVAEGPKVILPTPPEVTQAGAKFAAWLAQTECPLMRAGKMPDAPESHADIEPETLGLRPGDASVVRGNRIAISCPNSEVAAGLAQKTGGEQKGDTLTVECVGFLKHFILLANACNKPGKTGEKVMAKFIRLGEICSAYLEILDEMGGEPLPNADEFSNRKPKWDPARAAIKASLLLQADKEKVVEGTPLLSPEEIQDKAKKECRPELSTGEALQLAVILAERELAGMKTSRKRETLLKMRAQLASAFFEACKGYRKDGHPGDRVLPQKPRYKTPCVVLIRHPKNEHVEVVCINPQSSISYWGNPEAEKEKHAIIAGNTPPPPQTIPNEIKKTVKWAGRWLIAGIVIQLILAAIFLAVKKAPQGNEKQPTPIEATTKENQPASEPSKKTGSLEKKDPEKKRPSSVEWN